MSVRTLREAKEWFQKHSRCCVCEINDDWLECESYHEARVFLKGTPFEKLVAHLRRHAKEAENLSEHEHFTPDEILYEDAADVIEQLSSDLKIQRKLNHESKIETKDQLRSRNDRR